MALTRLQRSCGPLACAWRALQYDIGQLVPLGQVVVVHYQNSAAPSRGGWRFLWNRSRSGGASRRQMTRGNQRELARAKNLKKQGDGKKGREIPEGTNLAAIQTR